MNVVNWFLTGAYHINKDYILCRDEVWFQHSENTNSQNNRFLILIQKVQLHDVKVGVWCDVCATTITEPILFPETINSHQYVTQILTQFSEHKSYYKRTLSAKQCNKSHSKQFWVFSVFILYHMLCLE